MKIRTVLLALVAISYPCAVMAQSNPGTGLQSHQLGAPTALLNTYPIPGTARTAMRSDAAPAINQAMQATWTETHIFDHGAGIGFGTYFGDARWNSWNAIWSYGTASTPVQAVNPDGGASIYGASRVSDGSNGGVNLASAIGVFGKCFNDDLIIPKNCWGGYFEGRLYPNVPGGATGIEVDVSNLHGSVKPIGPYQPFHDEHTRGIWVGSGGECTAIRLCYDPVTGLTNLVSSDTSVGIGLISNSTSYTKGILFSYHSLTGTDGNTGTGTAMSMPKGAILEWTFCPNTTDYPNNCGMGALGAQILSTVNSATNATRVAFTNSGFEVQDLTGAASGFMVHNMTANTVNGLSVVPGAAGSGAVSLSPFGGDANIALVIAPKGNPADALYIGGRTTIINTLQLGAAGSGTGNLQLNGNTSGAITVQSQGASGTYNFNLPTSAGTAGQPLLSGGGGASPMTFGTLGVAGGGTGAATFTSNAILKGNGTGALVASGCTIDANNSIACSSSAAFQPQFVVTNTTTDTSQGFFNFQKSRSGGNVLSGDGLGSFVFQGFANSGYQNSAQILASTTASSSGSNIPSQLSLITSNASGPLNQRFNFDAGAHIGTVQSAAATVSACGTSPSISGATDVYGSVTVGTATPTSCTISFGASRTSAPHCVVTSSPQVAALSWTTSTSNIVVTQTATSSNRLNYVCFGQ